MSVCYGALEAGGTKMVLGALDEDGRVLSRQVFPTSVPEETLPRMADWFRAAGVSALGIGSFGPLDLDPRSPGWGSITSTPKLAWRNVPLTRFFREQLNVPVGIDTDVNAAALAEVTLGAAKGLSSCLYVTVGTGIGGGLVVDGRPVHGLVHPEIGHIRLVPEAGDPMPEGICPYHGSCLEGLASGPAMEKRWGRPGRELPDDHPAWELETAYLAQLCCQAILFCSPEKILLGGGVMQHPGLLPRIRKKTVSLLGGYVCSPAVDRGLKDLIGAPGLGTDSGLLGAWLLAREAAGEALHD